MADLALTQSPAASGAALASDTRSLDTLRAQAKKDPDKALKAAATQFEALFMQMLLKSMRDATPQFDPSASDAGRTFTGMLDQQLSTTMSGKGLGLADVMMKQLSRAQQPKGGKFVQGMDGKAAPVPDAKSAPTVGIEKLQKATSAAQADGAAPQRFVDTMLPQAIEASKATGVPARFILGQAALESGWGKGEIRNPDGSPSHNLFGIKAGPGWTGRTTSVTTTEYVNGVARKQVEKFRAYDSYADGFSDYARLIANNPRYAAAVKPGNDAAGFAQGLARGGYATDPAYAAKLTKVINSNLFAQRGLA